MDMLKKYFPFAFKVGPKDTTNLVVSIIIHAVAFIIVTTVLGIIGKLLGDILIIGTIINILCWIVGVVIDLYCLIGIVLAILLFLDVLK